MNYSYSGIIFPLACFISILIYGFLILIHENLKIKRLWKIIINETCDYVPIIAVLISADYIYSIGPLSTLAYILFNIGSMIFSYPLAYILTMVLSYIYEIII